MGGVDNDLSGDLMDIVIAKGDHGQRQNVASENCTSRVCLIVWKR